MEKYTGKAVYKGITIGEIVVLAKNEEQVKRYKVEDSEAEIQRFTNARDKAIEELGVLYEKAVKEVGKSSAAIFEIHQMMLEDDDYVDAIHDMISIEKVNAEYAVAITGDNFSAMFASMDDEYMKARAADVKDISNRVVSVLLGASANANSLSKPSIIFADDLTPSETVQMDKSNILAFVTVHGSTNSHTAILARMMNIPAMIGVDIDLNTLTNGDICVVDSMNEEVIINPTEDIIKKVNERMSEEDEKSKFLETLKGKKNVTLGGKQINVYANIGNVNDLFYVLENDAGGIGLFRSEFLYLGREDFPTEEEQIAAYRTVLQTMGQKKVIIRTLDIGADKQVDYFNLGKEENPALGYRAIRICLTEKDIFKTQLRALFRASVSGNLSIMYPMITSVEEVMKIKEIVDEVKKELDAEGLPYKDVEQGIMIETPAAALISDELAPLVDFFSIGTNDLTQYTLAIDRQNAKLDAFYNPHHKAILKMIQMVVDNSHKYGKWTGICGELGADLELTETFIKMGVDELSVAPAMVLKLRKVIRGLK